MDNKQRFLHGELKWANYYSSNARIRTKRWVKRHSKRLSRRIAKQHIHKELINK